ncbi:MAG: hypothetical protein ACPG21_01225 [Crocinitomicaceae bacterium]
MENTNRFKESTPYLGNKFKAYMIHADLICFEYHENAVLDEEDVKECIKAQEDMHGDRLVYRIQIAGKQTSMTT